MTRRLRILAAILATALVASIAASSASAHAVLVGSSPANGATIHGGPDSVVLRFDEDVAGDLSRVSVVGATSGAVPATRIEQTGDAELTVSLPHLKSDLYRVEWYTVATDDLHATGGTIVFGVDRAAPVASSAIVTSTPSPDGFETALRWAQLISLAVVSGVLAMLFAIIPTARRRGVGDLELLSAPLLRLGVAGCVATIACDDALMALQLDRAPGGASVAQVILDTGYGRAWIAREVCLVVLLAVLLGFSWHSLGRRLGAVACGLGCVVVASLAAVSHSASLHGVVSVPTALIAIHLLAATFWVGGVAALCMALLVLRRAGKRIAALSLARCFGSFAAVTVGLVVLTGLAVLGGHIRTLDGLVHTTYGQAMMVKTGLFLAAGMVGLLTSLALRSQRVPRRLRVSAVRAPTVELVLLISVLVPAALLTAAAPARDSAPRAAPAQRPAPATFANTEDLVLSIAVEPNRPGINFITVGAVSTRQPAPAPVGSVSVSLTGVDGKPRIIALVPAGNDQWQAAAPIGVGRVQVGVTVRRPGLAAATASMARTVAAAGQAGAAPREQRGLMHRALEPILTRVAAVGALAMTLALLLMLRRSRRPADDDGAAAIHTAVAAGAHGAERPSRGDCARSRHTRARPRISGD